MNILLIDNYKKNLIQQHFGNKPGVQEQQHSFL